MLHASTVNRHSPGCGTFCRDDATITTRATRPGSRKASTSLLAYEQLVQGTVKLAIKNGSWTLVFKMVRRMRTARRHASCEPLLFIATVLGLEAQLAY